MRVKDFFKKLLKKLINGTDGDGELWDERHIFVRVMSYEGPPVDINMDMTRAGYQPLGEYLHERLGNGSFGRLFQLELKLEENDVVVTDGTDSFRQTLSVKRNPLWNYTEEGMKLQFEIYKSEV